MPKYSLDPFTQFVYPFPCGRCGAFKTDPASAVVCAGAADDKERALLLRLLPGAHPEDEEPAGRREPRGRGAQQQDVRHLRPRHGHHSHKENTENLSFYTNLLT